MDQEPDEELEVEERGGGSPGAREALVAVFMASCVGVFLFALLALVFGGL